MVVIDNDEIYKEICLLTDKYFPSRKPYFYNSKDIIIVFGDSNCKCPIEDGSLVLQNLFILGCAVLFIQGLAVTSYWFNFSGMSLGMKIFTVFFVFFFIFLIL